MGGVRDGQGLPPLSRWVWAVVGAVGLALLLTSGRYGFFGDELYFVAAGNRPSFGYADQPPLLPLLASALDWLGGGNLYLFRLPATLATMAGVLVCALTARELGAAGRGQLHAAGAYATATIVLGGGHLLATSTLDPLVWAVLTWLLARWVRTRNDGCLLWFWLAVAVGLQVKYLLLLLLVPLGIAVLVHRDTRAMLRRPLFWVGLLSALASAVPGLLWQYANGWPQLGMGSVIAGERDSLLGGPLLFVPVLAVMAGLVGAVLGAVGLWRLLRAPELAAYRFLGWTALGVLLLCLAVGGRSYYVSGLFALLFAAGGHRLGLRPARGRWLTAVGYGLAALLALGNLPLEPATAYRGNKLSALDLVPVGQLGWPQHVAEVVRAYQALEPSVRAETAVITDDYWSASAIDYYGPMPVYSPHRGFWHFGAPPERARHALFLSRDGRRPPQAFHQVRQVGTLARADGVFTFLTGSRLWFCTGRRDSWAVLWPRLHHLE